MIGKRYFFKKNKTEKNHKETHADPDDFRYEEDNIVSDPYLIPTSLLNSIEFAVCCCEIPEQCISDLIMLYSSWVDITGKTDVTSLLFDEHGNAIFPISVKIKDENERIYN